jgi:hypothetical protein
MRVSTLWCRVWTTDWDLLDDEAVSVAGYRRGDVV